MGSLAAVGGTYKHGSAAGGMQGDDQQAGAACWEGGVVFWCCCLSPLGNLPFLPSFPSSQHHKCLAALLSFPPLPSSHSRSPVSTPQLKTQSKTTETKPRRLTVCIHTHMPDLWCSFFLFPFLQMSPLLLASPSLSASRLLLLFCLSPVHFKVLRVRGV